VYFVRDKKVVFVRAPLHVRLWSGVATSARSWQAAAPGLVSAENPTVHISTVTPLPPVATWPQKCLL
jgi:hypothetical protein